MAGRRRAGIRGACAKQRISISQAVLRRRWGQRRTRCRVQNIRLSSCFVIVDGGARADNASGRRGNRVEKVPGGQVRALVLRIGR